MKARPSRKDKRRATERRRQRLTFFQQQLRQIFHRARDHQPGIGKSNPWLTAPGKSSASATTIPPACAGRKKAT